MIITRTDTSVFIKDSSGDTLTVGTAGGPQNRWVDFTTDRGRVPVQITTREEAEAVVNTLRAVFHDSPEGRPC